MLFSIVGTPFEHRSHRRQIFNLNWPCRSPITSLLIPANMGKGVEECSKEGCQKGHPIGFWVRIPMDFGYTE